jgi:hypothetical protein
MNGRVIPDRSALFYPKADLDLHLGPPQAGPEEVLPFLPALCRAHLGTDLLRAEPLTDSCTFHRVYRLSLTAGREVIARFNAFSHRTLDLPLWLDHWAGYALRRAGLPALEVYAVDLSRSLCPWDLALLEPARGVCLRQFDGDDEVLQPYLTRLGALLAQVHRIGVAGFGLLSVDAEGRRARGSCDTWAGYLGNHLERHLDVARHIGAVSAEEQSFIRRTFAEAGRWSGDEPAALLHGDPGNHNVFVEAGEVTALIDWEDALAGDPAYEVAFWATFHPERRHAAFFEGYFGGRRPEDDFMERFWLYFLRVALAKTVVRHNLGLKDVPGRPPAALRIQRALRGLAA